MIIKKQNHLNGWLCDHQFITTINYGLKATNNQAQKKELK